jgi:SAM-dependent methyltransferase
MDIEGEIELLRGLGLDRTGTLVDLGAGTGTVSLAAAPFCKRAIAVDPSPAMLAALRAKLIASPLVNVELVQAGFLTYEHTGAPSGFVYSRHALHHLPDLWKAIALQRIAGFLDPGGILRLRDLVFSFDPGEARERIEAWLTSAAHHPGQGWTRPKLETHLREEYSTFSWLLEPMIERAGFEIRDAEYSSSGIFAAYTCVRR